MIVVAFVTVFLSLFSTAVMSYISMAIPIGPWIAPTVVLLVLGMYKIASRHSPSAITRASVLTTAAASVGGIVATGVGFSYPAIYFLDPPLFNQWLSNPWYFAISLGGLVLSAGALGIWFAHIIADSLIIKQNMSFPIGGLVYKMIAAHQSIRKTLDLIIGFVTTSLFCLFQDGLTVFKSYIPKSLMLVPKTSFGVLTIPAVAFDVWPLLWAIGFVTGHVIALPLAVGALAKIFMIDLTHTVLFSSISSSDFVLAFCSGMVLAGAIQGFFGIPSMLVRNIKMFFSSVNNRTQRVALLIPWQSLVELVIIMCLIVVYGSWIGFSFAAQGYLVLFTLIVAYQLAIIAGKIGLAPLGRFATFVMVPAMFLFRLNPMQIIITATFVEICGGVVADVLFGLKMAQLGNISRSRLKCYQYVGLVVSALCVGLIFWLLISHFNLGSHELFAQKAQTRALLINAHTFNMWVVLIGVLFGIALKYLHMNPALILSGILMPINLSVGLIFGGLLTYLVKDKEEWYPFWSGVFAANSVWMLLRTLLAQ